MEGCCSRPRPAREHGDVASSRVNIEPIADTHEALIGPPINFLSQRFMVPLTN